MALQYILDSALNKYAQLGAHYLNWFRVVSGRLCYPDTPAQSTEKTDEKLKAEFDGWLGLLEQSHMTTKEKIAQIKGTQSQLMNMVNALISQTAISHAAISAEQFKGVSVLFNAFIKLFSEMDKKAQIENTGIDVFTGLRSKRSMHLDLARELEKMERQGIGFAVAMLRIDFYGDIAKNDGQDIAQSYQKIVAQIILEAMRSYDDAYRLHSGEFLLCFKQSDTHGGMAAIQRVYGLLAEEGMSINIDGQTRSLTVSSCIAEPLPEDDVDQLLSFLRDDLGSISEGSGSLLAYSEISPIERYANAVQSDLKHNKNTQVDHSEGFV